ncbi:DNA helicase PIF1, ATP-dependent [Tanacetum coccineum]
MAALPQSSPHLFLDELEVDGTGTIIVMIGRVWDVNAITGRYLSTYFVVSDSKVVIYDNDDIPSLQELKAANSCVEPNKGLLVVDCSQRRERTIEKLLIWARNRKNDTVTFHYKVMIESIRTKNGWNYPSCGGGKCRKSVTRQLEKFLCETCNKTVDYPVLRYRLEVVVADDTAHTVVVMFNEIATALLKYSDDSLIEAEDESVDDESGLPTAIRNLIGTTHVMELKSHTYYEYGTYESFICWKINLTELVEDGASSSHQTLTADDPVPFQKSEVEDSDADEVSCPAKDSNEFSADGPLDKKKKQR